MIGLTGGITSNMRFLPTIDPEGFVFMCPGCKQLHHVDREYISAPQRLKPTIGEIPDVVHTMDTQANEIAVTVYPDGRQARTRCTFVLEGTRIRFIDPTTHGMPRTLTHPVPDLNE